MNKLVSKFNKKQFAVFVVTLICVCLFTATTVYAAGDVSTAITSTWNAAKAQIKTVVNNVVFPVVDTILAILFFVKSAQRISITENMVNSSLQHRLFFSLV